MLSLNQFYIYNFQANFIWFWAFFIPTVCITCFNWWCITTNKANLDRLFSVNIFDNLLIVALSSFVLWLANITIGFLYAILSDYFTGFNSDNMDLAVSISLHKQILRSRKVTFLLP